MLNTTGLNRTRNTSHQVSRRAFVRLFGVGLGASLLAACQQPAPATPTSVPAAQPTPPAAPTAPAATQPTQAAPSTKGQVTLRFSAWHMTEKVWGQSINEALAIFKQQNPNIDVQQEPVAYGEMVAKYTTQSQQKNAPDVFTLPAFAFGSFFDQGFTLPLDDFVKAEGANFLSQWHEVAIGACTYNGKLHAMPDEIMAMVLAYNAEMFEAAGLDPNHPPETWDEFLDVAKKLTNGTTQWGFGMVGAKDPGFPLRFNSVVWSFGGDFLTPDNKQSALDKPETVEAFTFYVSLNNEHGVIPPGATQANPQDVRTMMAQKKIAMKIGSGWTQTIVNSLNPDLKAFEVIRAAPMPYKRQRVTTAFLKAHMISASSRYPEEAWKLIKFLTSREIATKWFKDNGVTPSRKDVAEIPEIKNHPFASVVSAEVARARFEPLIPQWPQIVDAFTTATQEAITKQKSPEQALGDAHRRINQILARG